jgi:hypothetical protein
MKTIITKTIHYSTVNDLLSIVRKFDKGELQSQELFTGIERILSSSGWHMSSNTQFKGDTVIDRGL